MKTFIRFMAKKYPNAKENQFFSAGYISDTSYILWSTYNKGYYKLDSFITSSDKLDSTFRPFYKKVKCKKLAIISEKGINHYIKEFHLKKSGGPISIIRINEKNEIIILKNDFSKHPLGQMEMRKY